MGEFKTPFPAINRNDIRHIYSGIPREISLHHSKTFPTIDQLRQKSEDRDLRLSVLRTSQMKENRKPLFIPKAPAFRALPSDKVHMITNRIRKPTTASAMFTRTMSDLGHPDSSNQRIITSAKQQHPRYMGLKKVDEVAMKELVDSLSRPTRSSEIRHLSAMRDHVKAVEKLRSLVYGDHSNKSQSFRQAMAEKYDLK